jgi:hypothetical protein
LHYCLKITPFNREFDGILNCFPFLEHSTVGLAQAWDQLDQLAMRMQHNLEQQIQARNQSGVSEEALREFSMMFRHFDKDKLGRLDHQQFKSCLRALGYDLPMVDEGQPEPEFQRILDVVDPNRLVGFEVELHLINFSFSKGWLRNAARIHGFHDQQGD